MLQVERLRSNTNLIRTSYELHNAFKETSRESEEPQQAITHQLCKQIKNGKLVNYTIGKLLDCTGVHTDL